LPALSAKIGPAALCITAPFWRLRQRDSRSRRSQQQDQQTGVRVMTVFRILLIFSARMIATIGFAAAAMLLGWIITAHAASLVPDDTERQKPILCGQGADAICPPDLPGLVTMPATLVAPAPRRLEPFRP